MSDLSSRGEIVQHMLHPRSIALIGASPSFGKINGRPLKHLLDKGYGGLLLPVNPKYPRIADRSCYASIADLPVAADLAVVAVPAAEVIATVRALGQRGVRAAVVFSSGFGEMGAEGRALQSELAQAAREAGVLLCGPNCLGFINAFENVYATFSQYADGETGAGPIAFVTQSGAFGTAIAALVRERGLGLGYFINTGNEIDLGFSELMRAVIDDPRIRVAAGYLEGLTDGAALVSLAKHCQSIGKPLVLTKVGRLAAGARAAASHTGSLAVEDTVFDAVLRQYGVLRARNEEQMLDMLEALSQPRRPAGDGPANGLGIATQSGGAGVMMADRAEEVGLAVPQLAAHTQARLKAVLPAFSAAANPVNVTGQFVATPTLLSESVVALLDDPAISIVIVWLQLMTAHVDTLVEVFRGIQGRSSKPFFVCWTAAPPQARRRLRELGIVVFGAGERAVEAAAALVQFQRFQRRPPVQVGVAASFARPAAPRDGVQATVAATDAMLAAGFSMAPVALAQDVEQAVALWRAAGKPVAMKIESPSITHKTEVGGVLLKISSEAEVRAAYQQLLANAARAKPTASIIGVLVQPMASGQLELVIGVQRNPVFGMLVMVGLGGVLVEVLKDVAFRRAPFDVDEGRRMLGELRASALFDGVRGQGAVDRNAIAALLARLSQWADAMQDVVAELDLNPVLVGPDGLVGVDCVLVFDPRPECLSKLGKNPSMS